VTDRRLWPELGKRYAGQSAPALTLVEGRRRLFELLCGLEDRHPRYSFERFPPHVECEMGIAQPGLSLSRLQGQLAGAAVPIPAQQVRDLMPVWHDTVQELGSPAFACSV